MTFAMEQYIPAVVGQQPALQFFAYAPQFHWHVHGGAGEDVAVRHVVEQIARDAHAFGQNTEQRITELQTQQAMVDHRLLTLPTQIREDIQKCPIEVQLPQGRRAQWDVETR